MIDIQRRNAFAHSFVLYPDILQKFADVAYFPDGPMHKDIRFVLPEIFAAQFLVRLMKTRGQLEEEYNDVGFANEKLDLFILGAIQRYKEFSVSKIGDHQIHAPAKHREALLIVEDNMAEKIFQVLAIDVQADEARMAQADVNQINPNLRKPFDEADFWRDLCLSFDQIWKPGYPRLIYGLQYIILDHLEELRAALKEIPETVH